TSRKSTTSATSASARPGASGFRSTATTYRPSSRARTIARRCWRPAPTKRTRSALTGGAVSSGSGADEEEGDAIPALDLAAVAAVERGVDLVAAEDAGDAALRRAAPCLRACSPSWDRRERRLEPVEPPARLRGVRQRPARRLTGQRGVPLRSVRTGPEAHFEARRRRLTRGRQRREDRAERIPAPDLAAGRSRERRADASAADEPANHRLLGIVVDPRAPCVARDRPQRAGVPEQLPAGRSRGGMAAAGGTTPERRRLRGL